MRQIRGFTLIELMIVLAVVAIILAIALPSYQEQVRKGRRADAARAVGQLQLDLESWRAECPTYADSLPCKDTDGDGTAEAGEGVYPVAPASDFYAIAPSGTTGTEYIITATPAGAQTGDRCGNLVSQRTVSNGKPIWQGETSCN